MYLNNSVNKIYASNVAPNPIEVTYWADLSEAADGSVIKTFDGTKWVPISGNGGDSCSCTFTNGTDGSFTVTKGDCESEEGQTEQKVSIGKPATAGHADTATTLTGLTATVAELNYCDGVTSAIQTQLNGKASTAVASASSNGLMSSTDKSKLDGIAANANNYTLPNASTSAIGGVLQGAAVADAVEDGTETATTVTATLNALLASLRTAGIIAA